MPPSVFLHILKFYLTIIGANAERIELAGSHLGSVQDLGVEGGGQADYEHQQPDGHCLGHLHHPWRSHSQISNLKPPAFESVKV